MLQNGEATSSRIVNGVYMPMPDSEMGDIRLNDLKTIPTS